GPRARCGLRARYRAGGNRGGIGASAVVATGRRGRSNGRNGGGTSWDLHVVPDACRLNSQRPSLGLTTIIAGTRPAPPALRILMRNRGGHGAGAPTSPNEANPSRRSTPNEANPAPGRFPA